MFTDRFLENLLNLHGSTSMICYSLSSGWRRVRCSLWWTLFCGNTMVHQMVDSVRHRNNQRLESTVEYWSFPTLSRLIMLNVVYSVMFVLRSMNIASLLISSLFENKAIPMLAVIYHYSRCTYMMTVLNDWNNVSWKRANCEHVYWHQRANRSRLNNESIYGRININVIVVVLFRSNTMSIFERLITGGTFISKARETRNYAFCHLTFF